MIASITKIFTATAIMQLYDNGTLDLDTDINNYIPFGVRNPNYPSDPITTRMLLTHTSGINHGVSDEILWDWDVDMINWQNIKMGWNFTPWDPRPTLGEFLNGSLNPSGAYYAPENWQSRPGTRWGYSNTGFLLLSYLVEQLTNQSYAGYLQKNVFDPLDMTSTGFNYTDFTGRNAIPYELRNNTNDAYPIYNQHNLGAGALRSTVPDLANFLIAHMNQGSYNSTPILLPQTVDLMQTRHLYTWGTELCGFQRYGQGLGWPLFRGNIIGHSGAIHGFLAQIAFKTVNNGKYGIVFMVNRGVTLVEDDYLANTFFPSMIDLLLDEAARLFSLYKQLAILSSPFAAVPFTINEQPQSTPYQESLIQDSYVIEMPETHGEYNWAHWLEDGDTNRTKVVIVNTSITLTGVFCHFCDLDKNGCVNMKDIAVAASAFGSDPNHPRWNPNADINRDNKVDLMDIGNTARNFGKT